MWYKEVDCRKGRGERGVIVLVSHERDSMGEQNGEGDRGIGSKCKRREREKRWGVFYFRMLAVSTGDAITGC